MVAEKSHEPRVWYLKYGGKACDLATLPRCGAKSKRTGQPCMAVAMANGRCHWHGGKSTGPRTPAGKARCGQAHYKHGRCIRKAVAKRQANARLFREVRALLDKLQ